MSITRPGCSESGVILPLLALALSQIVVPIAILFVAAPLAWLGQWIPAPPARPLPCVERYTDDGDRPVVPDPPGCDAAPQRGLEERGAHVLSTGKEITP